MSEAKPFDLSKEIPWIHNTGELEMLLRKEYIIENIIKDYDTYQDFLLRLTNIMRGCITIRACREYPVKFKFYKNSKKSHTLELRHFFINAILWQAFIELNELRVLNEEYILDCYKDIPNIEDYINYKLILTLRKYHIANIVRNSNISEILYNLRQISGDFSDIMGFNFNLRTFIEMYTNNKTVRDIMEISFPDEMQPHEVESELNRVGKIVMDEYTKLKDNPIGVILRAKTGLKTKQFIEFSISDGLFPTLQGQTIPITVNNSMLIRGVNKPSYYYVAAIGSRKSLVMNKKVMGRAGHFGKMVLLLTRTLSMSTDVYDCGSKHLIPYEIKTNKHLNKISGKHFMRSLDDDGYEILNPSNHKDLVGHTIYVRSAATCCLGDKVCPKCLGISAGLNYDIADGISAFESEEITKVINQNILSTKHLLTTESEEINFNPEFDKFFIFNAGEINPNVNDNTFVDNINDYAIYIDPEDIEKIDDMDDDSQYNTCIGNGRFYIKNLVNPDEEDIVIQLDGEKEIFISEDALNLMKSGKDDYIHFKDVDDDIKLFEVIIMNQELTASLYKIMDLINKQRKKGEEEDTIESISQKMLDLLIDSGIGANVIAAELIINRLIRSTRNPYMRPDFNKEDLEPYTILTVNQALEHNYSPLIGVSFQYINRQFLSEELYKDKHGTSFIDPFYKTKVDASNLKKYAKIMKTRRTKSHHDEV
jgi:hypothetical protein